MISSAFKGAYTNEVSQRHAVEGNIQAGIKQGAALAVQMALGLNPEFRSAAAEGAGKFASSRLGGIGGATVRAIMNEKAESNNKGSMSTVSQYMNKKGSIESNIGDISPDSALGKKIVEQLGKEETK